MSWERWIKGVEIEPSIYAGDFARLDEQLQALLDAGARIFNFEVGDGHFIDEITIGPVVLKPSLALSTGEAGCSIAT